MRRILSLLFALVLGLTMTAGTAPSATAVQSYCGLTWGSLAKGGLPVRLAPATLDGVRSGRHQCFDRLVIDLSGRPGGYSVRYVSAVVADGSGEVVAVRGGARLAVVIGNPAYSGGRSTLVVRNRAELVNVTGYSTFRQVALAGSFEGQTTVALGVRARLPFRVFTLGTGADSRLVIDVAHRW